MEFKGKVKYTLKNDYMFKAVLQKNEKVLRGLTASLLDISVSDIQSICIENPIILGESIDNKTVILDILLILNDQQRINIEMQVVYQAHWKERSISYLCKLFNQLDVGEEYTGAMRTVHIGIIDFELFPGENIFYSKNTLMDKNTHRIYSDKLALNVLCLKHIEAATQKDKDSGLYDWARLFAANTWEELKMISENNDVLNEAVSTMRSLTEDQKIRLQCEVRRLNEMAYKLEIQAAFEDGVSQEHEKTVAAQKQAEEERKQREEAEREVDRLKEMLKVYENRLHK